MKKYEQLTEDEKVIRTLVFAIQSFLRGDTLSIIGIAYLNLKLTEAEKYMEANKIPKV